MILESGLSLSALFCSSRTLEDKDESTLSKILSRIAYNRFSGGKWYPSTPLIWPCRCSCLVRSFILPFLMCHVFIVILLSFLISLWVDFYMRHAILWGRFLSEATGRNKDK